MLKISPTREHENRLKVRLCGKLTKEYVPEIERLLAEGDSPETTTIDLTNVTFVDRDAMVFLCSVKSRNIKIENCPPYVVRWIQQERLCTGSESTENNT